MAMGCIGLMLAVPVTMAADDGLKVMDAWVRFAPASMRTHGGYLTIVNGGQEAQELIGASSPNYNRVEIHQSKVVDGIAAMELVASIEIPAGGKVVFAPGGYHLMLLGPKAPLQPGGSVPLRLSFRSGAEIDVEAKVVGGPGAGPSPKDHMHGM
jgi:hypothetical protein